MLIADTTIIATTELIFIQISYVQWLAAEGQLYGLYTTHTNSKGVGNKGTNREAP